MSMVAIARKLQTLILLATLLKWMGSIWTVP